MRPPATVATRGARHLSKTKTPFGGNFYKSFCSSLARPSSCVGRSCRPQSRGKMGPVPTSAFCLAAERKEEIYNQCQEIQDFDFEQVLQHTAPRTPHTPRTFNNLSRLWLYFDGRRREEPSAAMKSGHLARERRNLPWCPSMESQNVVSTCRQPELSPSGSEQTSDGGRAFHKTAVPRPGTASSTGRMRKGR